MKSILILFFLLSSNIVVGQTDSIKGNIKSVREKIIFLDSTIQNRKLFGSEDEYGHYGFVSPEFTFTRFNKWWYHTYWCHYLNYYREHDSTKKLNKEIWFYKNDKIRETFNYLYDERNNLIQTKSFFNDSSYYLKNRNYNDSNLLRSSIFTFSKYPNEYNYENYIYDSLLRLIEIKIFDEYGETSNIRYEYTQFGKLTKEINHYPYVWVKIDKKSTTTQFDKIGTDHLYKEYIYDEKQNIIKEKQYTRDYDNHNKVMLLRITSFKYDTKNRKIEEYYETVRDTTNTAFRKFEYYKNDLLKNVKFINVKDRKQIEEIIYSYDKNNNIESVIYKEEKITNLVNFKYKFDANGNWVEQTKIVNNKPLYFRTREIIYF